MNHFASLAKNSGADGVVCSVHEAEQIKQLCGKDFITVTPEFCLADSAADDQKESQLQNSQTKRDRCHGCRQKHYKGGASIRSLSSSTGGMEIWI